MSRTRATLILSACAIVAITAAAPGTSRGGSASEVRSLAASESVSYESGLSDLDEPIAAAYQRAVEKRNAEVAAYLEAVHQAELERQAAEAAAAEAARVEAERAAEAERAQAEAQAAPAPAPERAGACGGWADLIAAYFPGQEATACRVMMCESGGDPYANNPSGASGLFQVMPGWADEYQSVTGLPYYDGRFDPEANTKFAAWLQGSGGWGHWVCY